jgi:hypothetical protein
VAGGAASNTDSPLFIESILILARAVGDANASTWEYEWDLFAHQPPGGFAAVVDLHLRLINTGYAPPGLYGTPIGDYLTARGMAGWDIGWTKVNRPRGSCAEACYYLDFTQAILKRRRR